MNYYIIAACGDAYAITNLYDCNGEDTKSLADAVAAVIRIADDHWVSATIADLSDTPIHRVH